VTLRRGFKSEAETISLELRDELGLTAHDRLDCADLAAHLAIEIAPITDLADAGANTPHLDTVLDEDMGFSAMTVYRGTKCRIFYNPLHPPTRNVNSIAHEISHVILEHEPGPVIGNDGARHWDETAEAEATWLAGALLVPRDGALRLLATGTDMTAGAAHYAVSAQLFSWRAHNTGVVAQLRRRAA
jgi:Zn-dependent peptidase ImmA (M78 family)